LKTSKQYFADGVTNYASNWTHGSQQCQSKQLGTP